jgi:hypothetical protein
MEICKEVVLLQTVTAKWGGVETYRYSVAFVILIIIIVPLSARYHDSVVEELCKEVRERRIAGSIAHEIEPAADIGGERRPLRRN